METDCWRFCPCHRAPLRGFSRAFVREKKLDNFSRRTVFRASSYPRLQKESISPYRLYLSALRQLLTPPGIIRAITNYTAT